MNCSRLMNLAVFASVFVLSGGCTAFPVKSDPQGSQIFLDDRDTGLITPGKLLIRHLPPGKHRLSVVKDGYDTVRPPRSIMVQRNMAVGVLTTVLFLPVGLYTLLDTHWKSVENYEYLYYAPPFELKPRSPSTTSN